VSATRDGSVEAIHRVALALVGAEGRVDRSLGDIRQPGFVRPPV
jgi:L-asparaginase II